MADALGFVALCLAFAALHLSTFLNLKNAQCGAGTAGTTACADEIEAPPLLHSAAEVLPQLAAAAAMVALFVAVALTFRHLMTSRHVPAAAAAPVAGAAGNGRRRSVSGVVVMFALSVSAGTLQFIVFGQAAAAAAAAGAGHGCAQQARALGLAALRALPAAATVTFFCGMMLIVADGVAHVRPGGEAGGAGAGAVAGGGLIQGLLRLLTKATPFAAAALVGLMAMALSLTLYGANKYYD